MTDSVERTLSSTERPALRLSAGLMLLAAVSAAALACGGSDGDEGFEPIEQILEGEIRVVDLAATSASIRVTTTIPVVCSVIYGPDEAYGRISTDPDMGGTAHSDHEAPMRALEPDTLYHFRVQGTAADGTSFRSRDLTFRTPAGPPETSSRGENLALEEHGATIREASSAYGDSPAWGPSNAVDADPATEWSSKGDGDAAFVTVELAGESRISAVGLWTRTMGTSAEIREFRVVTDRETVLGPFVLPDATQLYTFDVDTVASWLRFEVVSSSGGNTGAVELAVFGEPLEQ